MEKLLNPRVSVLIPCRNEEGYIAKALQSLAAQDYPKELLEILVIDGMSTDATRSIIAGFADQFAELRILENPNRVVPHALNHGIRMSTGDVIVRLDAHSEYPMNYISSLLYWMQVLQADNVGGVWITEPANSGNRAVAIARALSHPFGIGNSSFRIGVNEPTEVDTVPFGCFRRKVFDEIGLFDEDLIRNQDDELNGRLTLNGGTIFLIPSIEIRYFARDSFPKLWRLYYQYGLFKPLVAKKLGTLTTVRQIVPPIFVVYLIISAIAVVAIPQYSAAVSAGVAVYAVVNIATSFIIAFRAHRPALVPYLAWAFLIVHLAYGVGYLWGSIRFLIFRGKAHPDNVPISR